MDHLHAWLTLLLFACIAYGSPEIAPTLESDLAGTNTVIHCPTLLVAWDGLQGIVGGPVQMQNQDALVQQLNDASCPPGVIPEEAHVSMAGFANKEIVEKLEKALRAKFGNNAPTVPFSFSDEKAAIISYSHLDRRLPFSRKFALATTFPLRFVTGNDSTEVQFFGVPERFADDYSDHVRILHYSGQDDFALSLHSKIADECIVLAKMAKPTNLLAGVKQTLKYLRAKNTGFSAMMVNGKKQVFLNTLSKGDFLAIPLIDLNVETGFPNLCNRKFTNKSFEQAWLQGVYQDIIFKMDESGAVIKSTASVVGFCESSEPEKSSIPRRFVFDKPFLLTLWKKNAEQPYFAAWIASPDVLIPFKTKEAQKK